MYRDDVQVILTVLVPLLVQQTVGTSCKPEYASQCLTAATEGQLSHLKGTGECEENAYARYSHTCSVLHYNDDVTQCCCVTAHSNVMCCRYHDTWNRFRCDEKDDVIGKTSFVPEVDENRAEPSRDLSDSVPLHIILPAVLVPTILLLLCGIFLVNQCYSHEEATCGRKTRKHNKKPAQGTQEEEERDALRDHCVSLDSAIPSAPPFEHIDRLASCASPIDGHVTYTSEPHSNSQATAPPTYAEALNHKVYNSDT